MRRPPDGCDDVGSVSPLRAVTLVFALAACAGPSRGVRDALRRADVASALGAYERFVEARGDGDADLLADIALVTLRRFASSDDPGERSAGFAALRSVGPLGVDALEPLALREGVVGDLAALTLWEVRGREGAPPPRLRAALRSDDRERRLAGLRGLRPTRSRRRLLRLLRDTDPAMRAAAAARLSALRSDGVTEALLAALRDDAVDDVRAACVRSLGGRGDEVFAPLAAALEDRSAFVRMAAPSALVATSLDDARARLLPTLVTPATPLRVETARALAARGDDDAARYLLDAMRGDRASLRAQAAVASTTLLRAHGPALAPLLDADDPELVLRVASALSRAEPHRDAAMRALRRLARSPDGFVAARALQTLAARGDAGLSEPIRQALASPEAGVRRVAVMAWGELTGASGDVDALAPLLRDEDRSVVALAAMQIILAAAR